MTVKKNKSWMASSLMTAMLVGVLTSVPARANVSQKVDNGHPDVSNHLASFKQKAHEARRHAGTLDSMTPARQLDWRSHAHSLETLKQQVNQLGQTLTTLEELKPQANEGQRMAIDNARPHLAAMAEELTQALNLLSDDRKSVYRSPYTDRVSNLYDHAESLYETVDTIMDYENARSRLSNLDVTSSAEGS